jgi:starvation-inducible DNA-binding protein
MFYSVHKLTDDQYQDLARAVDAIAERIRAIGFAAPTGFGNYAELSMVSDATRIPRAGEMVHELAEDHQRLAGALREIVEEADRVEDVYTADLLTARIGAHEEAAWMLNAMLVEDAKGTIAGD